MHTSSSHPFAQCPGVTPRLLVALVFLALFAGCSSKPSRLMPRPNLYADATKSPFEAVPESLRTPDIRIIFATDRYPEQESANMPLVFGSNRSSHLQIGFCRVTIGKEMTWESLVEVSLQASRPKSSILTLGEPDVVMRYPGNFWRMARIDDPSADFDEFQQRRLIARDRLNQLVDEQLQHTPRKEVIVYIHGYNNSFNDAVTTIANLWHFIGRKGVPIAYSWPAGSGGFTGYTTDSESGEFTIFHLKMFLEDLAANPNITKINILAHSRGTEVTISAIRELGIAAWAAGKDPRTSLKLGLVALASPDIDMEVASQRISSERVPEMMERLTVYLSPTDKALRLSRWLHQSVSRLGLINVDLVTPEQVQAVAYFDNVDLIDTRVKTDFLGHGYFYNNPSVSSDVILLLGEELPVGADNGRPLHPLAPGLWRLEEGYPNPPVGLIQATMEATFIK